MIITGTIIFLLSGSRELLQTITSLEKILRRLQDLKKPPAESSRRFPKQRGLQSPHCKPHPHTQTLGQQRMNWLAAVDMPGQSNLTVWGPAWNPSSKSALERRNSSHERHDQKEGMKQATAKTAEILSIPVCRSKENPAFSSQLLSPRRSSHFSQLPKWPPFPAILATEGHLAWSLWPHLLPPTPSPLSSPWIITRTQWLKHSELRILRSHANW